MSNAAVPLLARMLFGISNTGQSFDADAPDFSANFEVPDDHTVSTIITLPTGDEYRVTVEWLAEESP